jgi:hypothetical protein
MISLQEKWRAHFHRNLGPEGWGNVIEKVDRNGLFSNWHRIRDPGSFAETYLGFAVEVLCGDLKHPYAETFLQYAGEITSSALDETDRWLPTGDWGNPEGWPGRVRGTLLRAKEFTGALKLNAEPNPAALVEIAQLLLSESREGASKLWTEVEQSIYLSGVELLLIAGNISAAREALKWRKSFNLTRSYHDWLKSATMAIPDEEASVDPERLIHFDGLFDHVRDPTWGFSGTDKLHNIIEDHNILRIQLALIKQRVVLCKPIAGHWSDVIRLIAE